MKKRWTTLSKTTYLISILIIPIVLLVQSMFENPFNTTVLVLIGHLLLLLINAIHITLKLLIGLFKQSGRSISLFDTTLSLLFLVFFGYLYLVILMGGLAVIFPFIASQA